MTIENIEQAADFGNSPRAMEKVAHELRALESSNGRLLPSDVVEAARDVNSPLHAHFEWDDGEAANKWRLEQARTLIRSVKITVTVRQAPLSVVGYVRDPAQNARDEGYRSVTSLRSGEDSARAVVIDEMKRVASAAVRAKTLAAVLGLSERIEEIEIIANSVIDQATPSSESAAA